MTDYIVYRKNKCEHCDHGIRNFVSQDGNTKLALPCDFCEGNGSRLTEIPLTVALEELRREGLLAGIAELQK